MKNKKLENILVQNNTNFSPTPNNLGRDITRISNKDKLNDILFDSTFKILDEAKNYLTEGKKYLDSWEEIPCKKNLYKARDMLESLYKNGNRDEDLFICLGDNLGIIGDYEKALSIYQNGLQLFPQNFTLKEGIEHVQKILSSSE